MWQVAAVRLLRVYAPYVTLPFAAVVGYIGYNMENFISDKYTPFNEIVGIPNLAYKIVLRYLLLTLITIVWQIQISFVLESIKESRNKRLTTEEKLETAGTVEMAKYSNVLNSNVSPSLQK